MSIKKIFAISTLFVSLGTTVIASSGKVTNAQSGLILREEASKSGNVITTVPNNTEVEIIEKTGEWYKVKYNNQEGYLFAEFVEAKEEIPAEQPPEEQVPEETPVAGTSNIISKAETNVYIMPQVTSTIIATIPKDTGVIILEEAGNWLYITTNNITGWVRAYRINNEAQTPAAPVEETPQPTTPVETEQPTEQPAEITTTATPQSGYINVESANVREEPSTDSKILTTLILNTGVKIIEQTGEWYKISYQDTYIGYISKNLITAN